MEDRLLYRVPEVAVILNISRSKVYELFSSGDLESVKTAVAIANDTPYGLGSYVFTTDPDQAARVADAIDAGMVFVNGVLLDSAELPFGGVKPDLGQTSAHPGGWRRALGVRRRAGGLRRSRCDCRC